MSYLKERSHTKNGDTGIKAENDDTLMIKLKMVKLNFNVCFHFCFWVMDMSIGKSSEFNKIINYYIYRFIKSIATFLYPWILGTHNCKIYLKILITKSFSIDILFK